MDEIDRFISDQNIVNFVDRLGRERDPAKLEALKRLLIQEENKFGASVERLRMAERHLANGHALIVRQVNMIAELEANGQDTGEARRTLEIFETIQNLFADFRARIYRDINERP